MYKWYADDSNFEAQQGDNKRPIHLFGGILISRKDEINLCKDIETIKEQYTYRTMPLKYNFKDLKEKYKEHGRGEEHKKLLQNSQNWRKQLIEAAIKYDIKIFISCIENFQPNADKKELNKINDDLSSYLFANALMRVGLYAKKNSTAYTQVILDWPTGNNSKPFDKEYYYGYNEGTTSNGTTYNSRPLYGLNFDQTLYYARCNHSHLLQLSDIVLGATKEWIQNGLKERDYSHAKDLVTLFLNKFYGYPVVMQRGLNVSSKNLKLREEINKLFRRLREDELSPG